MNKNLILSGNYANNFSATPSHFIGNEYKPSTELELLENTISSLAQKLSKTADVLFRHPRKGNQHEANRPLAGDPVCLRHGDNASRHAPLASCRKPWLVLPLPEEMQEEPISGSRPQRQPARCENVCGG